MAASPSSRVQKPSVVRDLFIVGDFIKYFLRLFIPFALIGIIYGIFYECYFMCFLINPIIYAGGITLIIIIIKHDVNDIMALIGRAKEPQLALHIKHSNTIQKIGLQMSSRDYKNALETVNSLLKEEPEYTNALNLKGQILLEGFREYEEARLCFDKVMKLAKPDSEDHKLAQELTAESIKADPAM